MYGSIPTSVAPAHGRKEPLKSIGREGLTKRVSILDVATTVVLLVAAGLLLRPGGILRVAWARWDEERAVAAVIDEHWDQMSTTASRLYSDHSQPPEVFEFLDYQCPFCRTGSSSIDSALAAGLRIGIIHLPLPIHPPATSAALAALCGDRHGVFDEVHNALLQNSAWHDAPLDSLAEQLGRLSDNAAVQGCIADMAVEVGGTLQAHVALAAKLGVSSTPYFVAKGKRHRGLASADALIKLARQ